MIIPIESVFCPCCAPVVLHTLSQYSAQLLTQPQLLLESSSLLKTVYLKGRSPANVPDTMSCLAEAPSSIEI
jgi:hypothetical protein